MKRSLKKLYRRIYTGFSIKNNDSGFTLLELLIAILILAVVMVPMLNSFVVNARVNRKAKIKLRSTMIAQDIMEGLKGYSTDDIYKQFSGESDFRLIANTALDTPDKVSANTVIASVSAEGLQYTYYLKNLNYQGFNYDATVKIDGSPYKAAGGKTNISGDSISYNDIPLANISAMDSSYDGLFMSDNDEARKSMESDLVSKKSDALNCKINRTFDIILSENGVTSKGNKKQLAIVRVRYDAISENMVYTSSTREYTAYNNVDIADDGCTIRSLYFFYYPAYGSKYKDVINFINRDKMEVTLYVMKQKTTDPAVLSNLYTYELSYIPELYVAEEHGFQKTKVCTNIQYSLYDGSKLTTPTQAFYSSNGSPAKGAPLKIEENVVEKKSINRMFDAVVNVYEKGAADETPEFPKEKLLTTLDGTKINQ